MISVALGLAALAAFAGTALVARFSRWRRLSPWCTVCVLAGAALIAASGAADGHWLVVGVGGVTAVVQGRVAVRAARARCRIMAALAGDGGGGHG